MRIFGGVARSLLVSIVIGSGLLARSDAQAQPRQVTGPANRSTQVLPSPSVTPARPPQGTTQVAPSSSVAPARPPQGSTQVLPSSSVTPANKPLQVAPAQPKKENTQVLPSSSVTPANKPLQVQRVPIVPPTQIRPGFLRAWFATDSVKTAPCPAPEATCVSRWENKANAKNPAKAHPYTPPVFEDVGGGRRAVRFGITPTPAGTHMMPTPLELDGSFLEGQPYTVIAVVSRHLGRGENYFFGTTARNCDVFGCEANTGLHIGWRHDDTLTTDQYRNGIDLKVPSFVAPKRMSLVTVTAGHGQVHLAIEEAGARFETMRTGFVPLGHARKANLGLGANFRSDVVSSYPYCRSHCFSGWIHELVIYDANLDLADDGRTTTNDAERVREYLRYEHRLPPYDKEPRKGHAPPP